MNTIILCAALGLAIGLLLALIGKRTASKYTVGAILGSFIGAIVGVLVAALVICYMVPTRDLVYGPAKLVAMRSSDGISGTFVWGTGGIGSRTTYNFLQLTDDGSMVPGSVIANSLVHLTEDPALKNVGYWTTTIREADPTSALYPWATDPSHRRVTLRQDFRVPVGTVVQQFSVK